MGPTANVQNYNVFGYSLEQVLYFCILKLEKQGLDTWFSAQVSQYSHIWGFKDDHYLCPPPQILFMSLS